MTQVVVFVDLLGTSDSVSGKGDSQALLELLTTIAAMRSDFLFDGHSQEDGSYKFFIAPAISTFSDSIVLSFPIPHYELDEPEAEFMLTMYIGMALKQTRKLIGKLAEDAIKIGMLVRGGIALGELHHQDGVVMGPGLVEAYGLESRVSKYPRVTISSNIYSHIHINDRAGDMRLDKDGIWHLDYFRNLHFTTSQDPALAADVSALIEKNIHTHGQARRWNEYSKWFWFRSELAEVRRLDPNPSPESNVLRMPTGYDVK